MFTGIITAIGRVKKIEKNKSFILIIETAKDFNKKIKTGNSVAVDGCCLTAAKIIDLSRRPFNPPNPHYRGGICTTPADKGCGVMEANAMRANALKKVNLIFELMPETARLTIADDYKIGDLVNLESSLKVGDELGGHFVSGHIDGVGKVVKIAKKKNSVIITFAPPAKICKYLAHKGNVSINGVSLTIINPVKNSQTFNVSLVAYTLENTNLSKLKIGDKVNIEIDLLARYFVIQRNSKYVKRSFIKKIGRFKFKDCDYSGKV